MKLTAQLKTKLDLIRIEGLCKLLLNKYTEDEIINKISNVSNKIPKDKKAIYDLSRAQLIKIIELSDITCDEIENCYEEYRYGLKPGFSIFSFKTNKRISTIRACELIKEKLKENTIKDDEQPAIKNTSYNNYQNFEKEKMTEYSFYYLKKYSYINEKEEPTFIYELKETFAWISKEHNFIAIKNCDERVVKNLILTFSQIYDTELHSIVLTDELVKKIFGDKRKKVSGINLNATEKEAEKITISDSKLHEKEEVKKQLELYTTTNETLEITVKDILNTLGINNSKGKIHLTKNMTATVFREWSIETIKKIIEYITKNEVEFEIFKAKNIMSNIRWSNYTTEQRKVVEEIIYKILCSLRNKEQSYNPLLVNKIEYSKISKCFLTKVLINCKQCNEENCIPKCSCGSYDINLTSKRYNNM